METMIIKLRHELIGSHVHIRVWMGREAGNLGWAGDLCLRPAEWDAFRAALADGTGCSPVTTLILEETK